MLNSSAFQIIQLSTFQFSIYSILLNIFSSNFVTVVCRVQTESDLPIFAKMSKTSHYTIGQQTSSPRTSAPVDKFQFGQPPPGQVPLRTSSPRTSSPGRQASKKDKFPPDNFPPDKFHFGQVPRRVSCPGGTCLLAMHFTITIQATRMFS